ncbi:MAG: NAD-dependent epimerase/dehydratase family protein [Dehalococcoidia bacterium]
MKTVITGASGHLGINLIRALISKGRQVGTLSHISDTGLEGLKVEYSKGDVGSLSSLVAAFEGADVVYHLAAHISLMMDDWPRCREVNVVGTANVVEACRLSGVKRLVHFSSIHALCQEPLSTPVDESRPHVDSPKAPPYDRSKAAGEKIVRKAIDDGLNAIVINPTAVVGPYDYRPSHFGLALLQMARGKLPVLIEGGFDWVDVRDVVDCAIKAEEMAPAGSNYLLSGEWLSVKEVANIVAGIVGKKAASLVCPMSVAHACSPIVTFSSRLVGARPIFTRASLKALVSNHHILHDKATRELGYNPRPIRQTIADTIQWFKDNGYLDI